MTTMTRPTLYTRIESPVGRLLLVGDGEAIAGVHFDGRRRSPIDAGWTAAEEPFTEARRQLEEFFAGERTEFELPLAPSGTDFQLRIWDELREIPYGSTASY